MERGNLGLVIERAILRDTHNRISDKARQSSAPAFQIIIKVHGDIASADRALSAVNRTETQ